MKDDANNQNNFGNNATIEIVNSDWKSEAGPIKVFLNDKTVSEIMVNRWDKIFIERNGKIVEAEHHFTNAEALMRLVRALAVAVGKELNRRFPYIDARLPDGSRLNLVVPPVSLEGPSITIRKASDSVLSYQDLINRGSIDGKAVFFLNRAVYAKQNIVISGGTGSGKTTLLNVLSSFIADHERVVTLEDTAELKLSVKNIVRMETKPAAGSEPAITMENLLKNALRMRPDRIVVGECRGSEAMDMLMAMNTGHEGSLTTVHANSAHDALRRLESMVLRSGIEAPLAMIQMDIANTIHFIVQVDRAFDGKRQVMEILEVYGRDKDAYLTREIFKFETGKGLVSTGAVPRFVTENRDENLNLKPEIFEPEKKVRLT
ncbi:CpaF family protein [Bdellovibrio sp. HCB337]|uniref:CpaF family protein n=1 Tax=Bdellovibrio sp. HCB337 TaxID=3394358 RepID=UPI0039A75A6C